MIANAKRIVIACDTMKGTLSAPLVCSAIASVLRHAQPQPISNNSSSGSSKDDRLLLLPRLVEVDECPMSDGGGGLLDTLCSAMPWMQRQTERESIIGPRGSLLPSCDWGLVTASTTMRGTEHCASTGSPPSPQSATQQLQAVVEMALASGLALLPVPERDALHTTSYGVGQLLLAALHRLRHERDEDLMKDDSLESKQQNKGTAREGGRPVLWVGIGGSATNDGGLGALQALGLRIWLKPTEGGAPQELTRPVTGGDLLNVASLEVTPEFSSNRALFLEHCELRLLCDVTNPFVGPEGATAVYGPQKGAVSSAQQERLEQGMRHLLSRFVVDHIVLDSMMGSIEQLCEEKGAGGAGGLSGALKWALGAAWFSGGDTVAELVELRRRIALADVVVTGEGSFCHQTLSFEKTCAKVLHEARDAEERDGHPRRVVVVCGRTDGSATLRERNENGHTSSSSSSSCRNQPDAILTLVETVGEALAMSNTFDAVTRTVEAHLGQFL